MQLFNIDLTFILMKPSIERDRERERGKADNNSDAKFGILITFV